MPKIPEILPDLLKVPESVSTKRHGRNGASIGEVDASNWKEYKDVLTDSLWLLGKRDSSGAHNGYYHGNFVPQIPRQLLLRYTRQGDWVIDPFCGSGTTLIEASRLGRNSVGIDLNSEIAMSSLKAVTEDSAKKKGKAKTYAITGDSVDKDVWALAADHLPRSSARRFDFAILHPPYHDIITFNDNPKCLSRKASIDDFLQALSAVIENSCVHLKQGKYLAIVIGDKYKEGQLVPLGFYTAAIAMRMGLVLKGLVVKDIQNNRAKLNVQNLWHVRALKGGFFVFRHEYILVLKNLR